jgi:hypothetical protein
LDDSISSTIFSNLSIAASKERLDLSGSSVGMGKMRTLTLGKKKANNFRGGA